MTGGKTVAWVVGSGGLLGSAIAAELRGRGTPPFEPGERFDWSDPQRLARQMAAALDGFAARAADAAGWEMYWAAGIGTMGSKAGDLAAETQALRALLSLVGADERLRRRPGRLALTSSAGAIYAGSRDWIVTERSEPAPTTPYAREKLAQEALLQAFAAGNPGIGAVALRLSTVYGPRQARGKSQGLLSHIARGVVSGQPIRIYVPMDTVRDYVAAADAGADIVRAARLACPAGGFAVRIVASEQPTTISEIVAVFRRVARRPLRIVTGAAAESALYLRRVQFRSVASPRLAPTRKVSLLVGAAQVLEAERRRYARGHGPA